MFFIFANYNDVYFESRKCHNKNDSERSYRTYI